MYYLIGGSGIPNYGDELIAKNWLSYIQKKHPEERIVLECAIPSISSLMLQDKNWKASHISIIKTIAEKKPSEGFWDNVKRGMNFFKSGGLKNYPRLRYAETFMSEATVLHLIGGGYINERWPQTGFLLGFAGAMAEKYGTRVYGTGLGLMPIAQPPKQFLAMADELLSRFSFIEPRDKDGADFLQSLTNTKGIVRHNGLDDCFLYSSGMYKSQASIRTLHLSCFLDEEGASNFAKQLKSKEDEINSNFNRVVFWNCAPHRDDKAYSVIKEKLKGVELAETPSLIKEKYFGSNDFMISNRFHPHLMAARAGIKGYYYDIGSKYYKVKHKSVVDLGSSFKPFSQFSNFGFNFDSVDSSMMLLKDNERVLQKNALANDIYR